MLGSCLAYLVGNLDHHVLQQLGLLGGCMCTSHCRSLSIAMGSPGWRTRGFYKWKQSYSGRLTAAKRHVPLRRWRCYRCPADRTPHPGWPVPFRVASSSCSPVECPQPCPLRVRMNDKERGDKTDKKRTRIYVFQDAVWRRGRFVFWLSVWQFSITVLQSIKVSRTNIQVSNSDRSHCTWRYGFFYRF